MPSSEHIPHRSQRVALVTGGAGGIGLATATRLAADGAAVAIADLDAEAATQAARTVSETVPGARTIGVAMDVSSADSVNNAVDVVVQQLEGLHIVVNNAGVTRDNLLFKMTTDDWDLVLGVHLRGAFNVCKAAQARLVEQRWGRIVNLSSVNALGARGQANYSAAKMGLRGLTRTLAMELGPFGITVNAVAPGFIATAMTDATAVRLKLEPAAYRTMVAEQTPVRRVGTPDDVAAAIAWLSGDEASFITGQTLTVDGGMRL